MFDTQRHDVGVWIVSPIIKCDKQMRHEGLVEERPNAWRISRAALIDRERLARDYRTQNRPDSLAGTASAAMHCWAARPIAMALILLH
ncbi:MAG: hypothetical protein IPP13_02900 [Kouleothrix sp.]|jgi:hypothetical protein|nr:hypothetical protein [Kouleothrix sp.]